MVAAAAVAMTSCSESGPLTASSAKSALKKEAMFGKNNCATSFTLGYFEASESNLNSLAKLEAAGMITLTVDKVVEHVSRRQWNYWSSYYVNEEVNHYFANVQLTDAGKKFVVDEPVMLREDQIKDFKGNKDLEEEMPEYMSATYATEEGEQTVEVTEEVVEVADSTEADTVAVIEEVEEQPAAQQSTDPNSAYNAAQARVNVEQVYVRLGRYELVKVKEVKCTEDMFKAGRGSATFLYKFTDKTPFGFVFNAPMSNYVNAGKATFTLYQDMGWVADGLED